jgi:hypothetical protein
LFLSAATHVQDLTRGPHCVADNLKHRGIGCQARDKEIQQLKNGDLFRCLREVHDEDVELIYHWRHRTPEMWNSQ